MACALTTEQYIPVVENLIRLNPTVYNNYDNAARFILQSSLTEEQKKLALHNMAHIYNALSELGNSKKYKINKGIDIINSVNLIDNTTDYLTNAFKVFDTKKTRSQSFDGVISAIDALAKQSLIMLADLNKSDGVLSLFKNYISTHNFESIEEKTDTIDQIRGALKEVIDDMTKVDQSYKEVLYNSIDDFIDGFQPKSKYIPLDSISDIVQIDNILVTLMDGTIIEAIEFDGILNKVETDGTLTEIDPATVVTQKSARPADWSDSNDGKQVFKEDFFASGLTIDSVNPDEHFDLISELSKMSSPSSGIKITAVKLSDYGDMRVGRIKELAATEEQYAGLAKRDYETFENSTQVAYLESTPNGKVLTVSRPKATEQDFALVGEILATGKKFYIYSMDNFVFVSSDNTTEKLDLTNPGHLKMLQDMSLKKAGTNVQDLTNSDILSIVASQKLFQEFKEKIDNKISTEFISGNSIDVTDEFMQMYDFTNTRSSAPVKTSLKELVEKNPQFSQTVTVVKIDSKGDEISEEERQLPFYFTKRIDQKFGTIEYTSSTFLAANERIKVTLPNGETKSVTEKLYIDEVLNLNEKVRNLFKTEDANLMELLKNKQSTVRAVKTMHFVLKFPSQGDISYAIVDQVYQLQNPEFFAKFITVVSSIIDPSNVNKSAAIQAMQKSMYQFDTVRVPGKSDPQITIDFATSTVKNGRALQIEIRPYRGAKESRYGKIINKDDRSKYAYNFILPEAEILKLSKALVQGPLVQKVQSENTSLSKYNLSNTNDLLDFYTAVFELSKMPTATDSVKELATKVLIAQDKFTETIIDSVTKYLKANPDNIYGEFLDALKEDFASYGNFAIEDLFSRVNDEGKRVLKINSPMSTNSDARASYNRSMKNVNVLESLGRRSFNLVAKSPVNVSMADQSSENLGQTVAQKAIVEEVAAKENAPVKITPDNVSDTPIVLNDSVETEEDVTEENKNEEDNDVIDFTDDVPFSIADGVNVKMATQQDILTESQWLSDALPQFGLDTSSLKDLINLSRIDGTVLGMFKDRMIYLNDTITGKGTIYHEAFHGVFRYLLSANERKALIMQVMEDPKHSSKFTALSVKEFARIRNLSITNYDTLVDLIAEEILSDGFQTYMLKAKTSTPKTAMQRFFDMLKKLLNFFVKNRTQIENVYDRVKRGYYKTAAIKSNIYDGQVAFELIDGLIKYYSDQQGNVIKARSSLTVSEQEQLLNMMVGVIFQDKVQSDNFEIKFQRAADKVLNEIYSMEKLVAQNPEKREQIEAKYASVISTYRFILGARMKGLNVNDLNLSGNTAYDEKANINKIPLINGEIIDNTMGQYSFDTLRRLVKDKYTKANSVEIARDNDDYTLDSEEVENTFTGENANEVQDDEKVSVQEELENNDFDSGMGEQNRMDSYVAQIRRFFSTLRSDQFDEETGINFPRMIDGQYLFPTLLKITAGLDPKNIINSIGVMSKQMIKDGYVQVGKDLQIIFNEIQTRTKADSNGVAQSNKQLLNLVVEVLHGVELNYAMFNVASPKKVNMEDVTSGEELLRSDSVNFRMFDKVMDSDITKKRNDVIAGFIKKHSTEANSDEFKAGVKYLKDFVTNFMNATDILSSLSGQTMKLEKLTNEIHNAMIAIGLKVPRSLVELSLMAINKVENNIALDVDNELLEFYDVNENFIKQEQYLEKDFFRSLKVVLDASYLESGKPNSGIRNVLDDDKSKNKDAKRLLLILKKASAYTVKYDPTDIPSVIKNAEGKSIYRFTKYNPLLLLGQRLNTMTLEEALADDPYFENTLKTFMQDNLLLGPILRGENNPDTVKMQLFLDNFTVALFGGVQQRIGDVSKKGQSFKSVDERSLHMLQVLSFMDKKQMRDKAGNEISTYLRSFHQLEATSTNFLVSSIYDSFVSKDTKITNDKGQVLYNGKYLKIVEDLTGIVKQEYQRMLREWNRRLDLKANYENGTSNELVDKYNAVLEEDGKTINVDDETLRAYKFNILNDFFENESNQSLRNDLIDLAKKQVSFEDIEKTDLLRALDEYAKQEFQTYLEKLETLGLIEKLPINEQDKKLEVRPAVAALLPTLYYSSSMLPNSTKLGIAKQPLTDVYGVPYGTNEKSEIQPVEKLLYDMFMNNWRNGLHINQLMDGDMALNVKNAQDYVKRLKKIVASGSNMKNGTHKVAYMNTITAFIHEEFPQYGPYYKRIEIELDFTIPNDAIREELFEGYDKAVGNTKENINGRIVKWADMMREIFDGQSISSLMHQMDMHETLGRLDDRSLYILIAKHYRALTQEETRYLEAFKIVNNAKKTITADRNIYHKQSESYIDRTDVSSLEIKQNAEESIDDATARVYDELQGLYMKVYDLRKDRELAAEMPDAKNQVSKIDIDIQNVYRSIHEYYTPLPHRAMMHDILNSMELFQVDQLMDTTASKNATLLPLDVFASERTEDGYINFRMAALNVPNSAKYLQVETSGVKDKAKHSVQSKLLLPANISEDEFRNIIEIEIRKTGKVVTEGDMIAMQNIKEALNDYQISLRKATNARLIYFKDVLRKGNDFEMGKLFTMIRESLQQQNAPKNILDMFAVKPDGKPVFNPNLSLIRSTLEYYLIAQYSKNVTDEKVAGFKNFHESSFGYNVIVDTQTGEVITTQAYAENPKAYGDTSRFRSRPLGINVEIQEDGSKLYFVECILPKPFFANAQQEAFYIQNLTRMFGVRIPTEDKRSMIALKVVDFVDSSKMNNIIVPHFIHLLAGSDFDIDSLFGRMMSYYENGKGNYSLYGDYSLYSNPDTGKFIEFMHYMSKHEDIGPAIKNRKQELINIGTIEMPGEGPLFEVMEALGFDDNKFTGAFDQVALKSKYTDQLDFTNYMFELTKEAKELYVNAKEIAEQNPENRELAKTRNVYGKKHADLKYKRKESVRKQRETKELLRYLDSVFEYQAIMDVMSKYGMPSSVDDFMSNNTFSEMVSPKYQNQNLIASLQILANEAVFKYLYINQRSSTQEFKNILESFGIDLKAITNKSNLFTPTNMIESKVENNMNKDGIGRAAVMNKFLSLASQYNLKLSDKGIVWAYKKLDGQLVLKDTFGQLNDKEQRVISIIGNILGMFADGAKEPIPAALQMNEINASTTLAMIGIGLDPEFAIAFNFLPEVRKAALAVQQSQFALSEDLDQEYKFYNTAITEELSKVIEEDEAAFNRLKSSGVISQKSYKDRVVFDDQLKVKIGLTPKKLNIYALKNNQLTPSAIGFEMVFADNEQPLTENEMKIVLLMFYAKQAQQTWAINRASSVTNLFKRLNPSLVAFDRMRSNMEELQNEEKLFTKESSAELFASDQVWSVLKDALDDANEQFSKIFLERTPFFAPITTAFKAYFEDPKTISNTLTSFLALTKFKTTYPGSRKVNNPLIQAVLDNDDASILKTFTPEYWFTNDLFTQVEKFREKYPENEFLKLLRQTESKNTATVIYNGKTYQGITERFITMISKAKIKGDYAGKIADDIAFLYNQGTIEEKQFIKSLFYHDLVRTGLQYKEGSFLALMPAELKVPLSGYIDEFIEGIQSVIQSKNFEEDFTSFIKNYTGENAEEGVVKFFDEMFNQIAYAAASENNNQKIPKFRDKNNARGVLFTINSKNPVFSKPIVKAFLDDKQEANKETLSEAKIKAMNYVLNALELQVPVGVDLAKQDRINIAEALGEEFTINLSNKNLRANEILSRMFGIQKDYSEPGSVEFIFPSILRVGINTYVLQGIDDNASGSKSIGSNLLDSIMGKTTFSNIGTFAKYTAIPSQYASEELSPIAFSSENAEVYKRYIDKKEAIVFNKNIVDTAKEEKQPTQPSTSVVERTDKIVLRSELKANPTTLYLFGDNDIRKGLGGQAKEMRGEPNAIGVSTKKLPARGEEAYKSDANLQENKKIITDDINKAIAEWNTGKYNKLIIPQMGVGLAELPTRAPETYKFLQQELKRLEDHVTQPSTNVKEGVKKPAENIIVTDTEEGIGSEVGVSQGQIDASENSLEALMKMLAGTNEKSSVEVPKIQRGRYVTYNGGTYIVTQQNADSTWQIYNPLLEGAKAKISVAETNMKALDILAKIIEYKDSEYIVTSKNTIISLTTNKKMMWGENDGNRKAILAIALQNRTIIKPNNRPSIDPTDENNC